MKYMMIHAPFQFYFPITKCMLRSPSSFMFCYITIVASTDFKDQDYGIPVTFINNALGIPQTVLALILDFYRGNKYPISHDHGKQLSFLSTSFFKGLN